MLVASVIVRGGKAYIPTEGQMEGGGQLSIAPVQTSELALDSLTEVLERMCAQGNPKLPSLRDVGPLRHPDPVLKAAGVRSWTALARGGASYSIVWLPDKTLLYMSKLDEKGRFVGDEAKTRELPAKTEVRCVVELILADVASRPELAAPPGQ